MEGYRRVVYAPPPGSLEGRLLAATPLISDDARARPLEWSRAKWHNAGEGDDAFAYIVDEFAERAKAVVESLNKVQEAVAVDSRYVCASQTRAACDLREEEARESGCGKTVKAIPLTRTSPRGASPRASASPFEARTVMRTRAQRACSVGTRAGSATPRSPGRPLVCTLGPRASSATPRSQEGQVRPQPRLSQVPAATDYSASLGQARVVCPRPSHVQLRQQLSKDRVHSIEEVSLQRCGSRSPACQRRESNQVVQRREPSPMLSRREPSPSHMRLEPVPGLPRCEPSPIIQRREPSPNLQGRMLSLSHGREQIPVKQMRPSVAQAVSSDRSVCTTSAGNIQSSCSSRFVLVQQPGLQRMISASAVDITTSPSPRAASHGNHAVASPDEAPRPVRQRVQATSLPADRSMLEQGGADRLGCSDQTVAPTLLPGSLHPVSMAGPQEADSLCRGCQDMEHQLKHSTELLKKMEEFISPGGSRVKLLEECKLDIDTRPSKSDLLEELPFPRSPCEKSSRASEGPGRPEGPPLPILCSASEDASKMGSLTEVKNAFSSWERQREELRAALDSELVSTLFDK